MPSLPGKRECLCAYESATDGSAIRSQRGKRILTLVGTVGTATPQREPGLSRGQRPRVICGPGQLRTRGSVQQQGGAVDLVLSEREPIATRRARQDIGAQLRPRPGDEDVHRLAWSLRQSLRPQPFHEPLTATARAQVTCEQREEAAKPWCGDFPPAIGHSWQKDQVSGHLCTLTNTPSLACF